MAAKIALVKLKKALIFTSRCNVENVNEYRCESNRYKVHTDLQFTYYQHKHSPGKDTSIHV